MDNSKRALIILLGTAIVFTAGRFSKPAKIETKEIVKIVTQKEEAKTRIVYRDKITKPDGTVIEKEIEREDTQSKEVTALDKINQTVTTNDVGLVISALAVVNLNKLDKDIEYNLVASKRLLGGLNGTALVGYDDGIKIGIGLGWSF